MSDAVLSLWAQLSLGAPVVTDGVCPSTLVSTLANLTLTPACKPAPVNTGFSSRLISSSTNYVALSGVGTNDIVTEATFLYLRSADAVGMLARLTFGSIQSVIPFNGVLMMELDPTTTPLTLVEIQGVGTVEFFACGAV